MTKKPRADGPQDDSDQLYRTLVHNIQDYAIYMLGPDGTIRSWNRGAERIQGYQTQDVIGEHFSRFFLPEDRKAGLPEELLQRALRERSVEARGRRLRKDGSEVWVHAVIDVVEDEHGKHVGFAKIVRDISEEVQNEQALRSVAERILIETIPDGIITIDCDGLVISFNPAAERMFGYRANEVIGRNVRMLMPAPYHDEHDQYLQNYRESGQAKVIGIGREVEARRKDGTVFPIELAVGEFEVEGSRQFAGVIRDVTERKEVEAQARQLAAIVESSEAAIVGQDLDGTITSWNRGAERLYGYPASAAVGQPVSMLTPSSRRAEMKGIIDRLARNRRVKPLETLRVHKDGTYIDVSIAFSHVRSEDGILTGISSVARDITDIKEAERALTSSAEQVRALVETVPDGIVTISREGYIETFNPAAERLFGYRTEEVVGQNVNLLMPEPFHSAHDAYISNYVRTGQAKIIGIGREVEARRKDGTVFPIELAVGEFQVGEQKMFAGVIRDITERKQAEAAIHQVTERIRGIVETVPDGIITIDDQGLISTFNPAAEGLFGYRANEVIGHNVRMLMPVPYRNEHDSYIGNYKRTGEAKIIGSGREVEASRKDGSIFPIELAVGQFEVGKQVMFAGVIRDITERKRFEAALKDKNIELEQANLAKDRFLASMSHELRTPLNAIMGFTSALLMELPGALNDEQRKQLGTIDSSSRHLLSLINDLLDLAKIESGKSDTHWDSVNVEEIVCNVIEQLRPLAERKQLTLKSAVCEDHVNLLTDARALTQILINLTSNAIKFTEQGEVTVTVEPCATPGHALQIHVRDNGIGIAAEHQAKLFDAFEQLDATASRRYEGTGLGLHLCKLLCELILAELTLHSSPGEGSCFSLRLPAEAKVLATLNQQKAGATADANGIG